MRVCTRAMSLRSAPALAISPCTSCPGCSEAPPAWGLCCCPLCVCARARPACPCRPCPADYSSSVGDFVTTHDLANLTAISSLKVRPALHMCTAPGPDVACAGPTCRPGRARPSRLVSLHAAPVAALRGTDPKSAVREPPGLGSLRAVLIAPPSPPHPPTPPPPLQDLHNSVDTIESAFCKQEAFTPSKKVPASCTGPSVTLAVVPKTCVLEAATKQVGRQSAVPLRLALPCHLLLAPGGLPGHPCPSQPSLSALSA